MNIIEAALFLGAILTALSACAGLYWQRRSVRASEVEMAARVEKLEDIANRIEAERNLREDQIGKRVEEHKKLQLESAISEIGVGSNKNKLHLFGDIVAYQQFVMLYFLNRTDLDEKDPELSENISQFHLAVISYIGCSNHSRTVTKSTNGADVQETVSAVKEAVEREVEALEKAGAAGQAIVSRLHRIRGIAWSDGSSPDDHFVPIAQVMGDLSQSFEKLNELLD